MTGFGLILEVLLLTNLLIAMLLVSRGQTPADRILVALLFGTTGVALLLLLAYTKNMPPLVDVALVFALLAVISGAAFVQRAWRREEREDGHL